MITLSSTCLTNPILRSQFRPRRAGGLLLAVSLCVFLLASYVGAQTFPNDECSEQEITVPEDGSFVIVDTPVTSSPLAAGDNRCIVTFSTELATSAGLVLAQLAYTTRTPPTPDTCRNENIAGPVLTQVNGGFDETHTFVNSFNVFVHQRNAPSTLTIQPCMNSPVVGTYRLRRHCLILQCENRE